MTYRMGTTEPIKLLLALQDQLICDPWSHDKPHSSLPLSRLWPFYLAWPIYYTLEPPLELQTLKLGILSAVKHFSPSATFSTWAVSEPDAHRPPLRPLCWSHTSLLGMETANPLTSLNIGCSANKLIRKNNSGGPRQSFGKTSALQP